MTKKRKIRPDMVCTSAFFVVVAMMLLSIVFYRITGAEGVGYISAPIALFLMGYGIFIVSFEGVTKDMVRNHLNRGMMNDAVKNVKRLLLVSFLTGLVLSLICAALSGLFANHVFHTSRSFYVLFMIAPMLLFISIQGVIRGYLSGAGFLASSIYSNLILVAMSYIFSILFSRMAYGYGTKVNALMHVEDIAAAYGAIGATLGIALSCLISLIFVLIMFLVHSGELKAMVDSSNPEKNIRTFRGASEIIPTCLLYAQGGLLLFVDECVYLAAANKMHPNENNIENWGIYLGQCIAISSIIIFLLGIPFIKSWYGVHFGIVKRDFKNVRARITDLIHFESMLFFPIVIWVMILAGTMTNIIFGKTTAAAVNMIVLTIPVAMPGAFMLFHMFLLTRLRNYMLIAVNSIAGVVVHLVTLILMTTLGGLGIHASVAAFFLSVLVMAVLGIMEVKVMLDVRPELVRNVFKPLLAAGLSGLICLIIDRGLVNLIGEILTLLIALLLSYLIYMVLLIVLKAVNRYEVERMPFGDQFALLVDRIGDK